MIRDAELFSVGPDEVVVTFRTEEDETVTTAVGGSEVTTHGRFHSARVTDLEPETPYRLQVDGAEVSPLLPAEITTMTRPAGRLVATFATANDVHFGEVECGRLGTVEEIGPIFSVDPSETPYPEVMNHAAIDEMIALHPDTVIVKGDLTDRGTEQEYDAFCTAYGRLGERMHHFRGNHDAMVSSTMAPRGPMTIELDGVTLAVVDTVVPGIDRGALDARQLAWLDELAAESSVPVLVFGHHHPWNPASNERSATYFGINPDDSEALCAVIARREAIAGYFAGHTHRTRTRRFATARGVPIVEIACVKDYPGAWAEYRVYEGGYTQITRRVSAPDAMAWTEKTRAMFHGLYRDYALGSLSDRCLSVGF